MRISDWSSDVCSSDLPDIAADMCKRSLDADAAVAGAAAGETIATQQFTAQFEKQIGGRDPAQLHAVIEELVAEERLTDQRPVDEVIGMGVVRVDRKSTRLNSSH